MNELNIPLLRKAVEWAEAEDKKPPQESEWDQLGWMMTPDQRAFLHGQDEYAEENQTSYKACGTSYCIAGWICYAAGDEFDEESADRMMHRNVIVDGKLVPIAERAAELLGLSSNDSQALFFASNSIEDVRRCAEELAGGPL